MPRIRSLKPEFWEDEKLSPLPPIDRLVFLGLVSLADDAGRLVDSVRRLDGNIFPSTDDTCAPSLTSLESLRRISRYVAQNGQSVIQIINWTKHQIVQHPSKYVLPSMTPEQHETFMRVSGGSHETLTPDLGPGGEVGTTDQDQGPGAGSGPKDSVALTHDNGVADVIAHYRRLHPRARPGAKERGLIKARLKDGYSSLDLIDAIDGYHRSPFHCGENDGGKRYLALSLIVRDADHVRAGVEMPQPGEDGPVLSAKTKESVRAGLSWLKKDERRLLADGR